MTAPVTVVIVGGGAAGTLAAIHLTRYPARPADRVVILEPAAALGMGAAYGTRSPSHLLNVRAIGMSALPDDPGHFLAWVQGEGIAARADDFLPRMLYGQYLRDTLAQVSRANDQSVEHRRARATGMVARGGGWEVTTDEGPLAVDRVVLATGNAAPASPVLPVHPGAIGDPWAGSGLAGITASADVLIVGTGLTAVDVVLSLRDQGHTGREWMVSSHGLLPEPHLESSVSPVEPFVRAGTPDATSVRRAFAAARAAAGSADDWRQVVDGFRPQTAAVWRGLPMDERRRFLRHLARRWEVRRHRMAPQVASVVTERLSSGPLSVVPGRVLKVAAADGRLRVTIDRAGTRRDLDTDAVVRCTGPATDPMRDPFLAGLIGAGIARRHPIGAGLDVDVRGSLLGPDGVVRSGLWAMGSLRKGADWESTAVPELRVQARDIASAILAAGRSA